MTGLLLAVLISIPATSLADVPLPPGRSPFDLDYELFYQAAVAAGDLRLLPPVGPFYHSALSRTLADRSQSSALDIVSILPDSDIRFFAITTERYQARRRARGKDLPSLAGGAYYQPSSHFGTLLLFDLDRARALDPDYTGKKWRGLAGDIETAAIYFKKSSLTLTLGRQRVFWGPRPVNLLLSTTAAPLDLFSAEYGKGRLHFSFLFARLDGSRPDSLDRLHFPDRSFNDNRYLVGHRLDILFHRTFRLGLFETSLFGGEGRPPELYYLNPLQFFHTAQLNEETDDNTILGLDFTFLPYPGYSIYGQLLIDDFQIDRRVPADQEPNEIGLLAGFFKAGQVGLFSPDLRLEYVKITNRTYHQRDPCNRYLFRNKLLGHPLGPDADSLSLMIRFWPASRQFVELEGAYRRQGEGSIYQFWEEPWAESEGDYNEPFPTGVVEKVFAIAVRLQGYLPLSRYTSDHLFVAVEAGLGSIDNSGHVRGRKSTTGWLDVSVSWLGFMEVDVGN